MLLQSFSISLHVLKIFDGSNFRSLFSGWSLHSYHASCKQKQKKKQIDKNKSNTEERRRIMFFDEFVCCFFWHLGKMVLR